MSNDRRNAMATLVWTSLFAAVFLWDMGATSGRSGFVDRHGASAYLRVLVVGAVLLPALLVSLVGTLKSREEDPLRRIRLVAMAGALVLVGTHVAWVWGPTLAGLPPVELYQSLRDGLPHEGVIALYAIGLAAFAVSFEMALRGGAIALGATREATLRWVRIGSTLLPVIFFICSVNALGVFMVGKAVFFGGEMPIETAEAEADSDSAPPTGSPEGEPAESEAP